MPHHINEERTRKELIDPQLEKAGWFLRDHSKVKIEIPVDGYDAEPWNGVTDYCLYRENGDVLAVVEAKRASTDVRLAEAQLQRRPNPLPVRCAKCLLQKCHLDTADLYDAPALVGFGQDAVERWFTKHEVNEIIAFANRLDIQK